MIPPVALELFPVRWTVPRWSAAAGPVPRAGVVVAATFDGARGLGEASPLDGRSAEGLEACRAALLRARGATWDPRATPGDLALACEHVCNGAPAAAWALWSALLDARARARGVSVASLLAPRPATSLPIAAVVDGESSLRAAYARGVRTMKLKITPRTRGLVATMRDLLGPGAAIRVDANRSFAAPDVPSLVEELMALGVEYVEEPADLALAPSLATASPSLAAIALDETLADRSRDAWVGGVVAARAVAALVLKPTVLGPARTLALAAMARRAGVPAVLSHALEGPIGMAAAIELALGLGAGAIGALAIGLDAHPGLSAWKVVIPTLGPASLDDVLRTGTGIDLDRALERAGMLA